MVLTPNPTELAATLRLPEDAVDDDLLAAAVRLAQESRATVLSGDSTSYLVQPSGRAWRNETGVPGLATAGSGDTKAGAIVGLCARGASPQQAALWGAHCHGLAGERLAARSPGFLARDVVRELPCALAEIEDG